MPPLTFQLFLSGGGAGLPPSRWNPLMAILAGIAIIALGQMAAITLAATITAGLAGEGGGRREEIAILLEQRASTVMALSQAVMALLTLFAAGRYGMRAATTLGLQAPSWGPSAFVQAFMVMVPLLMIINAVTYTLSPDSFMSDFRQFQGIVKGPDPWGTFAAIGIGAPLWEEMLFRGFLLPPLAGALGFWPAAAVVSASWAILHLGYSYVGLAEVFAIGLVFAWLLKRTGSLWVPIACHAAYNSLLFMLIRFYA